jgi:hypothetical protein
MDTIKREKLAKAEHDKAYFSIIHNPRLWIGEIIDSVADPAALAGEMIELHLKAGQCSPVVTRVIQEFAKKTAEEARDAVLNYPGHIV